ncbi:MAG: hypothetical protein FJ104_11785, partial [Deltaproteobacteria bacterium]|nr:hypothetical protein [Deltaproteobacteria bacterium]
MRPLTAATVAIAVLSVTGLVLHAVLVYRPFFFDDSFISLRYARRFLDGQGLTWTDGERVEGYTNFLWVLLVAVIGFVTRAELVDVARIAGIACMGAALLGVLHAARPSRASEILPAAALLASLAISGPVAAWATGGLEQALLAALVSWGFALLLPVLAMDRPGFRALWPSGLLLGLAGLTRPDGILFAAIGAAGIVLARGFRWASFGVALRLGALPIALYAAQLLGRYAYYGSWVPNTFHAKAHANLPRLLAGIRYVLERPSPQPLYAALPLILGAAVMVPASRRRVIVLILPALAYAAYVATIGGDIMPERRHLVACTFLLALATIEPLRALAASPRRGAAVAAQVLSLALVAAFGAQQLRDPDRFAATRMTWAWTGKPVGRFIRDAFGQQSPLLAVDAAGSTPYYAGVPALDMLGLNDAWLARHPPANIGHGSLAHELGDARYVLRRAPDLVMFHMPPGSQKPEWRAGHDLVRLPEWKRLYQLVRFDTGGKKPVTLVVWVRRESGRIGIVREAGRVDLPGF